MGSSESLNSSVSSSIQQARANSLTKARLMQHNSQQQQQGRGQQQQQPSSEYSFASSRTAGAGNTTADDGGASSSNDYYGVFRVGVNSHQQQQDPIHLSRFKSQPTSPLKEDPHGMKQGSNGHQQQQQYASLPMPNKTSAGQTDADIERLRRELEEEHEKVNKEA